MEQKRVFKANVEMFCTAEQYNKALLPALNEMRGEDRSALIAGEMWVCAWGTEIFFAEKSGPGENGKVIIPVYNPELFLALCAMSAGEEFYPGEWVVSKRNGSTIAKLGSLYKIDRITEGENVAHAKVHSDMFGGFSKWMYLYASIDVENTNFRKATAEEIAAHFTHKAQNEAANDLIEGLNEAAAERDKTVEEIIYDQKNQPLQTFKTRLPKFGEDILVWDDNDEARKPAFFAAEEAGKVWAFQSIDAPTKDHKHIYSYDHWSLPDAPFFISKKELIKHIAEEFNVKPESVQIYE